MSLCKEKIEHGAIRNLFSQCRSSKTHKFMKRCVNKLLRIQSKKISLNDEENLKPKKSYKGWEY